ncbi:uncharacterized protein LOC127842585 isoform X2 [Dreissena polymorpha]|uniref:RRM domain-containing protein n=1 Tax=Dreissena polymorpha TaxID=45954 RepID=A0A9D4ESF7_DREPO|nr:uncharacterized protein LOC127842585 isoform X2 [Dreissena polymorpha]KAH3785665.1 hypothetical protein DPMN_163759 [Dreissena polymorpha]
MYGAANGYPSQMASDPYTATVMDMTLDCHRTCASDAYKTSDIAEKTDILDGTQTEILVEGIPDGVDEEILEMLFSSRKLKTCSVVAVDFDGVERNAVIKFENHEDVKTIMNSRPITIKKKEISVNIFTPKTLCTIIVRGPKDIMKAENEETFEMYFENPKRSGGGEVVDICFQSKQSVFYITFKDEKVAKTVVDKGNHSLFRKQIKVELMKPNRSSRETMALTVSGRDEDFKHIDSISVKTVKVYGISSLSNRESVHLYFESNKQSGDDIERYKVDEYDDDIIYIRCKDESVATSLIENKHIIDGHELNVSLYSSPPPMYPNRLLVKGLNARITFSILDLYLEAKVGLTLVPGTLIYHAEKEDTIMVTVNGDLDISLVEEACESKPLEGSLLRFLPVPISKCVLVSNLSDAMTEDWIALYFANTKRSNGGFVEKVKMIQTMNACVVHFAVVGDVNNVLSKEHVLDGRKLEVKIYFQCIRRAEKDTEQGQFKQPAPFTVKANIQKIKFLRRNSFHKMAVEKQLATLYATIHWPLENAGEDVELFCTLSENIEDCATLAKDWTARAKACFEDFMNTLAVEYVVVDTNILRSVVEKLSEISIANPESVAILIHRDENKIYIVGIQLHVSWLTSSVERIVKDIKYFIENDPSWTKVTISHCRPMEIQMLLESRFPSQMQDKFPEVKVRINTNKNEIDIEGKHFSVNKAMIEMSKIKDAFVRNLCEIPQATSF